MPNGFATRDHFPVIKTLSDKIEAFLNEMGRALTSANTIFRDLSGCLESRQKLVGDG